jgi:hypothetical protein
MENVACNVIYVDRSVSRDRCVRAGEQNSDRDTVQWEPAHIAENVALLLAVFDEGMRGSPPLMALVAPVFGWMTDGRI